MDGDIKLDGVRVVVEGDRFDVAAPDLVLDAAARRKRPEAKREIVAARHLSSAVPPVRVGSRDLALLRAGPATAPPGARGLAARPAYDPAPWARKPRR